MTAKLDALEKRIADKAEQLRQLKARKQQIAAQTRAKETKAKRAEENQRKYEVGGLAKLAGLLDMDKGTLLGILLVAAENYSDAALAALPPDKRQQLEQGIRAFKAKGDALLAERERSRKAASGSETAQGATNAPQGTPMATRPPQTR